LPKKIDGKSVVGVEGDYVVGGELSLEFSQYSTLRFTEFCREEIVDYLASEGWEEGLVTAKLLKAGGKGQLLHPKGSV